MRLAAIIVASLGLLAGCRTWQTARPVTAPQTLTQGQLVITSDFALPADERLLGELRAQREVIAKLLNVPTSDELIHVCLFGSQGKYLDFLHTHYPNFPERRAFFVETPNRLEVFAHWNGRIAEDLRHEVAHGHLHSIVRNLPLWLDEGLAEFMEVPPEQQGFNSPHIDEILTALQTSRWQPDLDRLEKLPGAEVMTQLDYAEAWAWVYFLLQTEPARRELLQQYIATLRKDPNPPPLSLVLRQHGLTNPAVLLAFVRELAAAQASSAVRPN